jgi:hypothetical protein
MVCANRDGSLDEESTKMASERSVEEVFMRLFTQAVRLWGEVDAERQRPFLQQTAEHIVIMDRYALPSDLEPRFF